MPELHIDGHAFTVAGGQSVLEAALGLGFDVPYFCWHPAMGSVGACRQCAVISGEGKDARLVMSCMTEVNDGLTISITDPKAADFRKAVIEGLMLNHPHDCPVCDEGGQCHLQDMTVMTGHDYRRYRFGKRTFRNQYLGPFVHHEMNRCIQCYRCVRFYREYAGGRDFNVAGISDRVFFGRGVGGVWQDGVFESEFTGNLAEVCPTGVFTDATLKRHYTRKWDLRWSPSVCPFCSRGCNISPGERYGSVRVVVNRYNPQLNGYFLCDRGRYGYEYLESSQRLRRERPETREDGSGGALEQLRRLLELGGEVVGIGSVRASLESNFALQRLVGADRFYGSSEACVVSPARAEECDAALIVGEDVTQTAARLALSIRQLVRRQPLREICDPLKIPHWLDHAAREAIQDAHGPLHILTPAATRLDDIATSILRDAPANLARRVFAVAAAMAAGREEDAMAADLLAAERPLIVAGSSLTSPELAAAAQAVVRALEARGRKPVYKYIPAGANSFGLSLLKPRPLGEVLERARYGHVATMIVVEADLARLAPPAVVEGIFKKVKHLVVLDQIETATTTAAEIVLPAAAWAESDGTLVNGDGLAQRFFRVVEAEKGTRLRASWELLETAQGRSTTLDEMIEAMAVTLPFVRAAAPEAGFRVAGQKIPREPQRYSGRTAMTANLAVSEPKPPLDENSPLSFTMEGLAPPPPEALTSFYWSPGWNSPQAQVVVPHERPHEWAAGSNRDAAWVGPAPSAAVPGEAPPRFEARTGQYWLLRQHHLFGSEELSRNGRAIASLAPSAYVGVGQAPEWVEGQTVVLQLDGRAYQLPVRFIAGLAPGLAVVPAGFAAFDGADLPAWCSIQC